jgi:hypothetical protein
MNRFQTSAVQKPLLATLMVIAALCAAPLASSQEKVLFPFGVASVAATSSGGVVSDPKGNLYFTANSNCSTGGYCATFFEISPPAKPGGQWLSQILVTIPGFTNAGLARDKGGNLYGTASGGAAGLGYVFQLVPPNILGGSWSYSVIYNFQSGSYAPALTLAIDETGNLYGGYFGYVFELKRPATKTGTWTESAIFVAPGDPTAVIVDKLGNVFGATSSGGTFSNGIVFELIPPSTTGGSWTEQTLYNFPSYPAKALRPLRSTQTSGPPPKGLSLASENVLAIDTHGNLFGTQPFGGTAGVGYVYELTFPSTSGGSWSFSNVYSFTGSATGSADGAYPAAAVVVTNNGALFGTTYLGGNAAGTLDGSLGTLFKLTPPSVAGGNWTEAILRRFTAGYDGANPAASLILGRAGVLYGATNFGGNNQTWGSNYMPGSGTVFQIIP